MACAVVALLLSLGVAPIAGWAFMPTGLGGFVFGIVASSVWIDSLNRGGKCCCGDTRCSTGTVVVFYMLALLSSLSQIGYFAFVYGTYKGEDIDDLFGSGVADMIDAWAYILFSSQAAVSIVFAISLAVVWRSHKESSALYVSMETEIVASTYQFPLAAAEPLGR